MRILYLLFVFIFIFFLIPKNVESASTGGGCYWGCTPGSIELACVSGQSCERWCEAFAPSGAACFGFDYYWSSWSCFGSCGGTQDPCGDGFCDASIGEDNVFCPADCPAPTPACSVANCSSRPCSDGSGCSCYGQCYGDTCGEGSVIPGTCPAVPTPTPAGCSITSNYCGSQCLSCGVTSDWYLDTCGNCVQTGTFTGNWCGAPCGGGGSAPTATPTPGSGGGGGTCGAGSHEESCLCGGTCGTSPTIPGCCADGSTCQSVGVGYECVGSGGGGGGGACVDNGNFSAFAFVDVDNNNQQTQPVFSWSEERAVPDAGSISINYTRYAQQVELFPGLYGVQVTNTSGTQNGNIDSSGYVNFPFSYEGNISFSDSTPSTVKGAVISGYVCGWGGNPIYSSEYVSGTGPWSINIDDQQVAFAFQQIISFGGKVFVDTDGDGTQDCVANPGEDCDNGPGDELNYSGATIGISGGGANATTNSSGVYTFTNKIPGLYTITLIIPSGFSLSPASLNPRSLSPTNGQSNISFGIRPNPAPVCIPAGINQSPSTATVNPGATVTLSVTSCSNEEDPNNGVPPPPYTWNPDTNANNPPPTTSGQTDTSTSSTIDWTAPSCPPSQRNYAPRVSIFGPGGTTNYTSSITVPGTYSINVNVRSVTTASSCEHSDGIPYVDTSNGDGAFIQVRNTTTSTTYPSQETITSSPGTTFTCMPGNNNYEISMLDIPGYSIVGVNNNGTPTFPGSTPLTLTNLTSSRTVTFCVAPIDPWFQTDIGDVRKLRLINSVPPGKFSSSDSIFPGVFYSSESVTQAFGSGAVSQRGWFINGEYDYNADTENRNGGMSYDFYKSKASRDGVTINSIGDGIIDLSDPQQFPDVEGGVYEISGSGNITGFGSSPVTITGKRIVLLVSGNVTIDQPIRVTPGNGLLIIAAKGNITITEDVGTPDPITPATLNNSDTHLDGFYTAQGSIVINGGSCVDSTTSDRRLNVGGALIANSLKPFSTTGTGTVHNDRSLCLENLNYPSLFISSRPDFLTQLTDFYKVSYSKWSEINP